MKVVSGLVTVIVPVYKPGAFLRPCVESILAQSRPDLELILIIDGGNEITAAKCKALIDGDSRAQVIEIPHGGVSAARNAGIDAARGEYITFVDADDILFPFALELLERTARNTGADAVCGRMLSGRNFSSPTFPKKITKKIYTGETAAELNLYQRKGFDNSVCAKLFRRNLFESNGSIRFPIGLRYEDLATSHLLFRSAGKVVTLDTTLYFYRTNPDSFINRWSPHRPDVLTVTKSIEENCTDSPRLLRAARERRFSANCNIWLLARKYGQKDVMEKCAKTIRAYRRDTLFNPLSRLKSRFGALVSYIFV